MSPQYVKSESKYSPCNLSKCWGTTHPAVWHHSPENLNAQELCHKGQQVKIFKNNTPGHEWMKSLNL
jgi:hypothetical protein